MLSFTTNGTGAPQRHPEDDFNQGNAPGRSKGLLAWLYRFPGLRWLGPRLSFEKVDTPEGRQTAPPGREVEREKSASGPRGINLPWFLPFVQSNYTNETTAIRLACRQMLADPNVKSALLSKILAVAGLDLKIQPASKSNPLDRRVAAFIQWALTQRLRDGIPGMVWSILSGGLVDGYSVCEKVIDQQETGQWAGHTILRELKPKDTQNDMVLLTDAYRNVVGVQGLRYNAGEIFSPSLFLIWRHLPLFCSPTGMSDLRAVYSRWHMLDTILKLRAMGLDKRSLPMLIGWYPQDNPAVQASVEASLERARSQSWMAVPDGVKIDAVNIAGMADAQFASAVQDLKHDIYLGITGAVLQSLEGETTDGRGNSQVHKSTSDKLVWHLAATIESCLNDHDAGLIKDLVDLNYVVSDYPRATLSAVDINELQADLAIDTGLHAMVALDKEEMYERYNRKVPDPEEQNNTIPPSTPPAGGGQPSGVGNLPGPSSLGFTEFAESFGEAVKNKSGPGYHDSDTGHPVPAPGSNETFSDAVNHAAPSTGDRHAHEQSRHHEKVLKNLHAGKIDLATAEKHIAAAAKKGRPQTFEVFNGWYHDVRDRYARQYGEEAMQSPEWAQVRQAFAATAQTMAGVHSTMGDEALGVARSAAKESGGRISQEDVNYVHQHADDFLETFNKTFDHFIKPRVAAFKAKFQPVGKMSEDSLDNYGQQFAECFDDGEYHGPTAPGPDWVESGVGPKGGKVWARKDEAKEPESGDSPAPVQSGYKQGSGNGTLYQKRAGAGEPSSEISDAAQTAREALFERYYGGDNPYQERFPGAEGQELDSVGKLAYDIIRSNTPNDRDLSPIFVRDEEGNGENNMVELWSGDSGARLSIQPHKSGGYVVQVNHAGSSSKKLIPAGATHEQQSLVIHQAARIKPPAALKPQTETHAEPAPIPYYETGWGRKLYEKYADGDRAKAAKMAEGEYHGPRPPGEGWVLVGEGPKHGKIWKPKSGGSTDKPNSDKGASLEKKKATRGQMMEAGRVGKGADAKVLLKNGKPAPEHITPGMVPPDWSDVQVSLDPNAELLVKAFDSKGRPKSVYSDAHGMRTAAVKFARVDEMMQQSPVIDKQIQEARSNPKTKDAAECAWLMSVQATRPGSETDTGADVKAYGATTLEGRHVVQTSDGVRLQFVGKEGVHHDHLVNNPELAKMLLERKKAAGDSGQLFSVNEGQVNRFIGKLDGGHFSAKDFRTRRANQLAVKAMARFKGQPKTEEQRKSRIKAVANMVSYTLGNKAQQCLESYINPAVFSAWQVTP